jgi:antitoxin component YwqK of YwqJK toxin-antitoxin module
MAKDRILRLSDIWDSLQHIRAVFTASDDSPWVPDGVYRVNDDNGRLRVIITYSTGVVHGPYTDYWSNGQIASTGQFENGYRHGLWQHYNKDGTLRETVQFVRGKELIDWNDFFAKTDAAGISNEGNRSRGEDGGRKGPVQSSGQGEE